MPILLLLTLLLISCTTVISSDGGATNTGNAFITGVIAGTPDDNIASRVITIAPEDADPLSGDTGSFVRCTTDVYGKFKSPNIKLGNYILYNRDGVDGILQKVTLDIEDENDVGELLLKLTGSLVVSPHQFGENQPNEIIIPGTPIVGQKNDEGQFILDSIPASVIPSIKAKYSDGSLVEIVNNKTLSEGEHTILAGNLSVLFLVQGDTNNISQSVINERDFLELLGFNVNTQDFSELNPVLTDLAGYDLIYGCNELLWDTNKDFWRSLPIPIATTSINGYEVLAMTDTIQGSHGTRVESTLLTDLTGYHPAFVGTGWSTARTVYPVENGPSTWGIPTSGATIFLKGTASQVEKYLFVYRKDTEMYHTTIAPAGRIAIYLGSSKVNSSTLTMSIIQRAIMWGMDKL